MQFTGHASTHARSRQSLQSLVITHAMNGKNHLPGRNDRKPRFAR
jgi:hypothetical protein